MDFLDPKTERRNRIILQIGYCFVALAIAIATLILVYLSYGYGVDHKGNVTQNGLLFISSQPSGATITLNGKPYKSTTDTRVNTPAGTYSVQVNLNGYRPWQRQIVVNGGDVQHFDYPFLFPSQLKTTSLATLDANPSVALQSLDKRWVLLGSPDGAGTFTEYDMKKPSKPVVSSLTIPDTVYTPGDGTQTWAQVEWAADNKHVLLQHTYQANGVATQEYILFNRDDPTTSLNLTTSLKLAPSDTVGLYDNKINQVYALNPSDQTLSRLNVSDGAVISKLDHVVSFKPYGSDMLLYVTTASPSGKLLNGQNSVVLQDGQKTITLRSLPANAPGYVLNLAQYSGDWYVGAGASNDTALYMYKNPQSEQLLPGDTYPAPWRRFPVANPTYLAFSANTQYVVAESGQNFVVYDFLNDIQYHYTSRLALDQPQLHATWMDGNRLLYVSGGLVRVFDYDYRNIQTLMAANAAYLPFFSADYHYLYVLQNGTGSDTKPALSTTPLTVPAL